MQGQQHVQLDRLLFLILLTLVAGGELDPAAASQKPSDVIINERDVIPEAHASKGNSRAVDLHRLLVFCRSDIVVSARPAFPKCPTDTFVNITSVSCRPRPAATEGEVDKKSQSCGSVTAEFLVTLNCDPASQTPNAAEESDQTPRVKLQQQILLSGRRQGHRCNHHQQQHRWRQLLSAACRSFDSVTIDYICQPFGHTSSTGHGPSGHGRLRRSDVAASRGGDSTPAPPPPRRRLRTTTTTAAAAASPVVTAAEGSDHMDGTAAAPFSTADAVMIAAATDPRNCEEDDSSCGSVAVEWAWTWTFIKDNREYFVLYSLLGASIGAVFILVLGILFLVVIRPHQVAARRRRRRQPDIKEPLQSASSSAASTQTSPTAESAFLLSPVDTPDRYRQQPRSVFFSSSVDSIGGNGNGDVPSGRLNVGARPAGGILRTPSSETSATALLNNSSSPSDGGPVGAALGSTAAVDGSVQQASAGPVDVEVSPSSLSAPDWAEFGEMDSSYRISRGDSYTNPYRHDTCRTIDSRTSSSRSHHRK